ncbi:MAG: hypothetical protein ACXV5T_03120 [Halobacteriota archaeon]
MKRIRTLFRGTDIKFTSVVKEGPVARTILQEASAEGTSYAQVPTSVVLNRSAQRRLPRG